MTFISIFSRCLFLRVGFSELCHSCVSTAPIYQGFFAVRTRHCTRCGARLRDMKPHLPKATLVPFLIVVFAGPTLPQELITAEELFSKGLELAVKSRDYKKALPYLEETVKKNPRHAEAWSYVGYCYGQLGEYKK